jgi:glutathionylspermidine synthase
MTEMYLKSVGLLSKVRNAKSLVEQATQFLDPSFKAVCSRKAKRTLSAMEDPVPKIVESVLSVAGQA